MRLKTTFQETASHQYGYVVCIPSADKDSGDSLASSRRAGIEGRERETVAALRTEKKEQENLSSSSSGGRDCSNSVSCSQMQDMLKAL
mmetsp:Transcript_38355/g.151601  ORF Transcript_38355/g.151601 Transcript_38355/m.151601 type:complete len:88 (+) Transcript_38355:34-297(+)